MRLVVLGLAMGLLAACTTAPAPAPLSNVVVDRPLAVDLVVSTNEPFWQALVEGPRVVLTGPEASRALVVERDGMQGDARHVLARDAVGAVEIVVTPVACRDGMSGAAFPWTGELRFAGHGVRGCARPSSMPPPVP